MKIWMELARSCCWPKACIRALTLARAFATATCRAGPRAGSSRSLNILTERKPMGLSSCSRLILLASHRMALTRERKNSSQIAREIDIFSIFAWLVPTLVPMHNSSFEFSAAQSVDPDDRLTFMKHLVEIKSQFPCRILFLRLAQKQVWIWTETGLNLKKLIFVDRWL